MKSGQDILNEKHLLEPYWVLQETADEKALVELLKTANIPVDLQWRYYYGYNDAIRIIDFVETEGIYDGWVVLLPPAAQATAENVVAEYASKLEPFGEAEERFFRGLDVVVLKQALASKQMTGKSLARARAILKEQNEEYSDEEIEQMKQEQYQKNSQKTGAVGQTKLLIWLLLLLVVAAYLCLVYLLG